MAARNPARLFAIMARDAPRAVILRRGPSDWVRLILWRTDTDTFECGQWFHGRIYERRCALSPDGALFLYFAAAYPNIWNAISKPPYLTALGLWPHGSTWGGGGLFLDNRTVWLNGSAAPHPDHQPQGLTIATSPGAFDPREPLFHNRLLREGWTRSNAGIEPGFNWASSDPPAWRKARGADAITMEYVGYLVGRYGDPYRYDYWLTVGDNEPKPIGEATWADWDHRGRLAFARGGQVFAVDPAHYADDLAPLADFNDQRFEPVETPEWARRW